MIPKVIHYCWLSNDPYPEKIRRCIASWRRFLPDYEIVLWNFDRFPRGKSKWVDQAYDARKYAFAADYIRLYALYHFGGIYLDSDVEVLRSFDDLLELPYFIGKENSPAGIEPATIGCEKGNCLIGEILSSFRDRNFINPDGTHNGIPLPQVFRRHIDTHYEYHVIGSIGDFVRDSRVINVFPETWFSPMHWMTHELNLTNETYSIHRFAGAWLTRRQKFGYWVEAHFGERAAYFATYFWRPLPVVIRSLIRAANRRCKVRL